MRGNDESEPAEPDPELWRSQSSNWLLREDELSVNALTPSFCCKFSQKKKKKASDCPRWKQSILPIPPPRPLFFKVCGINHPEITCCADNKLSRWQTFGSKTNRKTDSRSRPVMKNWSQLFLSESIRELCSFFLLFVCFLRSTVIYKAFSFSFFKTSL